MVPCRGEARPLILVAIFRRDMPAYVHRLVQHAPHANNVWAGASIEQKVLRCPHASGGFHPCTGMAQMISMHMLANLRPRYAPKPEWIGLDIEEAYAEQRLIALARCFAESFFRVFENSGDVHLCPRGKP